MVLAGYDSVSLTPVHQFILVRALTGALGLTAVNELMVTAVEDVEIPDPWFIDDAVWQANWFLPYKQTIYVPGTEPTDWHPSSSSEGGSPEGESPEGESSPEGDSPPASEETEGSPPTDTSSPPTDTSNPPPTRRMRHRQRHRRRLHEASDSSSSSSWGGSSTEAPPVLPAVKVSLQAVLPSFDAANTLLVTLLSLWDSSESGAAGALTLLLHEAKLAMAAPYGFVAPGALLDTDAVYIWHEEAPAPPRAAAANATTAATPLRNVSAVVTFGSVTPAQLGVVGGSVRGTLNASAPLVVAFRASIASSLALPPPFSAEDVTVTAITAVFNSSSSPSSAGRRLQAETKGETANVTAAAVAFTVRVNTSSVNVSTVQSTLQKTLAPNGTFAASYYSSNAAAFRAAGVNRTISITALTLPKAANVSLNTTAPPNAAAVAAAKKAAAGARALEGLLSESSKAVVIAVCCVTGVLLAVAITYTTLQARKRHQALLKLNSVGSN